ncbi:MAG: sigma-70 family RNA polymerase sigma factor [Acidobacteriota bacterium]|nr:sigma-70 family RNA polymerase sigma factor [Acidobacteriota bacterium]
MIHGVVGGFAERGLGVGNSQTRKADTGARAGEWGVKSKDAPEQSFDEIFLAHYSRVVGILRRVVGDHGRAEDLASEVFLKLYRQDWAKDCAGNVPGWLYRTATNLGIDALRAATRRNRLEQAAAREGSGGRVAENAFDQLARAEKQQRVRGVLGDLKPAQAQLLLLRASGHSYKELAAAMEIEAGSVGTTLIRAEAAFEQRYRELYGGEEDV